MTSISIYFTPYTCVSKIVTNFRYSHEKGRIMLQIIVKNILSSMRVANIEATGTFLFINSHNTTFTHHTLIFAPIQFHM